MSFDVSKTFTTTCLPELKTQVNTDLTAVCESIRVDDDTTTTFTFTGSGPLSGVDDTALDALLGSWTCPTTDLDHPVKSGAWTFVCRGRSRNRWMSQSDGSMKQSNWNPAICLNNGVVNSLSFVNQKDFADTDVEIYKNGSKVFTWQVRNKRWETKTSGLEALTFVPGDALSVFLRDQGTDPQFVIVTISYALTSGLVVDGGASSI